MFQQTPLGANSFSGLDPLKLKETCLKLKDETSLHIHTFQLSLEQNSTSGEWEVRTRSTPKLMKMAGLLTPDTNIAELIDAVDAEIEKERQKNELELTQSMANDLQFYSKKKEPPPFKPPCFNCRTLIDEGWTEFPTRCANKRGHKIHDRVVGLCNDLAPSKLGADERCRQYWLEDKLLPLSDRPKLEQKYYLSKHATKDEHANHEVILFPKAHRTNDNLVASKEFWEDVKELVSWWSDLFNSMNQGSPVGCPFTRISLNFGEWESSVARNAHLKECHGHCHFVLAKAFVLHLDAQDTTSWRSKYRCLDKLHGCYNTPDHEMETDFVAFRRDELLHRLLRQQTLFFNKRFDRIEKELQGITTMLSLLVQQWSREETEGTYTRLCTEEDGAPKSQPQSRRNSL